MKLCRPNTALWVLPSLLLAICFGACTRDNKDLDILANGYEVTFSSDISISDTTTKATMADADNLEEFVVYSYTTDAQDLMNGVTVTKSSGEWGYEDTKYVEVGAEAQFFAYSPSNLVDTDDVTLDSTNELCSFHYAFTPDSDNTVSYTSQSDLIYASTLSSAVLPISLNFNHAFSAIAFSAKGDLSDCITGVTISNVFDGGTFSIASDGSAEWSNQTISSSDVEFVAGITQITFSEDDTDHTEEYQLTNINAGGYILAIPQELYKSSQVNVTLTYADGSTEEKTLYINNTDEWEPGVCYIYTIVVESKGNIYIDEDVHITAWEYINENTYGSFNNIDYAYINLDDYVASDGTTNLALLRSKIKAYDDAGITRYIVSGEYFDGALGTLDLVDYMKTTYNLDITDARLETVAMETELGQAGLNYLLGGDDENPGLDLFALDIESPFGTYAPNIRILDLSGVTGLELFPFMFNSGFGEIVEVDEYNNETYYTIPRRFNDLNTVILPSYIDEIPSMTFTFLTSLKSVNLENIEATGLFAFGYCSYLKNIDLSSVKYVGMMSFSWCLSLTTVDAPLLDEYIGSMAFQNSDASDDIDVGSMISLSLPSYVPTSSEFFQSNITYKTLTYLDLSSSSDFTDLADDPYVYAGGYEEDYTNVYSNTHLILNQNKSQGGTSSPKVSDAVMWAGYKWGRISYVMDDGSTLDGIISLDDYDTVDELRAEVSRRVALGVSNFEVSGAFFEGCLGELVEATGVYDEDAGAYEYDYNFVNATSPFFFGTSGDATTQNRITTLDLSGVTGMKNDDLFSSIFSQGGNNDWENTAPDLTVTVDYTTEYVLPQSITEIPERAFINNIYLSTVNLLNITTLGDYAFSGCTSLSAINMPSITTVPGGCFRYCTSLRDVYLPILTTVDGQAFMYCSSLSTFSFDNIISLGQYSFGYTGLNTIYIPNITEIPAYAFNGTTSTSGSGVTIRIPRATSIGASAFRDVDILSLSAANVVDLGSYCFSGVTNITTLELESVATIDTSAFENSSLEVLTLPSANSIGAYAFDYCSSLTTLNLTCEDAITIASYAFTNLSTASVDLRLHGYHSYNIRSATPYVIEEDSTTWSSSTWNSITFTDGYTDLDKAMNLTLLSTTLGAVRSSIKVRDAFGCEELTITGIYTDGCLGDGAVYNEDGSINPDDTLNSSRASDYISDTSFQTINLLNVIDLNLEIGVIYSLDVMTITINNYTGEEVTIPVKCFHGCDNLTAFRSNCVTYIGESVFVAEYGTDLAITSLELKSPNNITFETGAFTTGQAQSCDLVLHKDNAQYVKNGNEWNSLTWKSITYVDDNGNEVIVTE